MAAHIPVALPSPQLVDVSPDGANLLVLSVPESDVPGKSSLWNVRVLGGSLRRIGEAADASFSPDGNSVAYSKTTDEIWVGHSDGTETHKLVFVRGQLSDIAWSPDGALIRFTRNHAELWEMSSSGANPHPLLPGWHSTSWQCCGRWTSDGKLFLFHSDDQIWALDERRGLFRRPSSQPIQVAGGPIRWGRPIPSKDGSRIFAEGRILRGELSRYDSKTKQFLPFLGGISAQGPAFSNDRKSVAYVTYPDGILWKANADGSAPLQLIDPPMRAFLPRWSPDGSQIVFSGSFPGTRSSIYLVSPAGGSPPKLLFGMGKGGGAWHSTWSPDGRRIVVGACSIEQCVDWNYIVRIFDLDTRQATTVPGSVGMLGPRWSPDGRYIISGTVDEIRLMLFDFKTQQWSELPQKGLVDSPEWSRDSHFIYFRRPRGDMGVFRIFVNGGKAEKIVDLHDWRDSGWSGDWMGLDSTDAPLLLRDIGSDEIYALTLEKK